MNDNQAEVHETSPNAAAMAIGVKSLNHASKVAGMSPQKLRRMFKANPDGFRVVMLGVISLEGEREREALLTQALRLMDGAEAELKAMLSGKRATLAQYESIGSESSPAAVRLAAAIMDAERSLKVHDPIGVIRSLELLRVHS